MEKIIMGILKFLNKLFYSALAPILTLLLVVIIGIRYNKLFIPLILYAIAFLCWIIFLTYIPKNNSNKYGIIFLINNNNLYDSNRNEFFKKLQYELRKYFEIQVVNNNFLMNIKTLEEKNKLLDRKNYQMLIDCFAQTGQYQNESISAISNNMINIYIPYEVKKEIIDNLQQDFTKSFHKIIEFRKSSSYNDVNTNTELVANSIRYLVSIINIIFGDIDASERLIKEIKIPNKEKINNETNYILRNIPMRLFEIEITRALRILIKKDYLIDLEELEKLDKTINKLEKIIESKLNNIEYLMLFYDIKSKLLFAKNKYYDATGLLLKENKKMPKDINVLSSLGFMYINMGNIPKGLNYYKNASKIKRYNKVNEAIEFIEVCLKDKKYDAIYLNLCLGINKYYWINKEQGQEIIINVINDIKNNEYKKIIKERFL